MPPEEVLHQQQSAVQTGQLLPRLSPGTGYLLFLLPRNLHPLQFLFPSHLQFQSLLWLLPQVLSLLQFLPLLQFLFLLQL